MAILDGELDVLHVTVVALQLRLHLEWSKNKGNRGNRGNQGNQGINQGIKESRCDLCQGLEGRGLLHAQILQAQGGPHSRHHIFACVTKGSRGQGVTSEHSINLFYLMDVLNQGDLSRDIFDLSRD